MNKQNKTPYGYYHCSKNGQGTKQCSMHYIRYDVLYTYVLSRIQHWIDKASLDDEQLLEQLLEVGDKERLANKKKQSIELKKTEKRKIEVDRLFTKMYEDWSAQRITEYNFNMLSQKYQLEQMELNDKINKLKEDLAIEQENTVNAEKWIELIKQYTHPTELDAELLNALIEKIVVHEAVKHETGLREQEIEIYYRFIGKMD